VEYHVSVDVAAAPEQVWAVLADVERWPEWTPMITRLQRVDSGAFGVGSTARIKQPRLPTAVWRVTEFDPGRSFSWVSRRPGVRTEGGHRVTPAAGGGATVTLSVRQVGLLAGPVGLLAGGLIRRYVQTEAQNLKRRCEAA